MLTFYWIGDRELNWPRIASLSAITGLYVPAGVPQGTKLGLWLFSIMINDLNAGEADMWNCVDDTTIYEVIDKGQESCLQQVVDDLAIQARDDRFQLNERKCKELRMSFTRNKPKFDPILVNHQTLESVNSVKLLGLNICSDLKWNVHVSELVRKVSTILYFLRWLKEMACCYKRACSILLHMHLLYSGVRQPSFSSRCTKLSKRAPRKTAKTCYEPYLP